ncbi:MAG: glucose-6-phosphate dehydrogenase [Melioribacteraceae bacterium]|nr:glucose-6-phosphate dehydrogenase [Melioribacteraceae bacterium]
MKKPENQIIIIFGASGDLAKRKLIPALVDLYTQDLMPDRFAIIGVSRTKFTDAEFRSLMIDSINTYGNDPEIEKEVLERFIENLYYQPINTFEEKDYALVKEKVEKLNKEIGTNGNYIFYLSTPPNLYEVIPKYLSSHGMNRDQTGSRKLIIEKPFGYDLQSAKNLNKNLLEYFEEEQLYRIDHYLGKETVQNLLVTRFSNGIFEPLWNRNFIDHVEITSAESNGVGSRGGYYENSGALRDMMQNHLLQMVGLVAMEPPSSLDSTAIRNETLKVFQSLRPIREEDVESSAIRGQYLSSKVKGETVKGYREEIGVDPNSKTETYAALKFFIDNWRWGGVPFYMRTGKRLPTYVTEVVIHFKRTPHYLFSKQNSPQACNQLIIRIQPNEGILLKFGMKVPGAGFNVQNVNMDFHYSDLSNVKLPTAYERLLLDAMLGDSTLYTRGDAVEEAWKFISPIQTVWENDDSIKIFGYPAGTWGPETADNLIEDKNTAWRYPCKNLVDDGFYCEL